MQVVFIHGPAASGKHTIGTRVAQTLGIPLFHNHLAVDAALALFDFGSPGFRAVRAAIWRAAFAEAAAAGRSFVFTFHPEASVDPALIEELAASVRARGGEVAFVELLCSPEAIAERLDQPSRHRFNKLTDRAVYEAIERAGGFAFPPLPALLRVDTQAHTPEESAALIAAAVREAR
ncbi:hypothetical protein J5226_17435 [Lysobacter sp. K5869]|uniref:AAA family ATPase n=1 Tax=Lysobacter sp. K5869 TaxID=2820808 RepID=UPI001C06410E|nr:hypothetical protein [Lysobacter sp. K5869]QWP75393.1 hypothetical protein J5226_17435 [Lysobacter sp. K5869]